MRLDPEEAALGEGEAVLTDAVLLRRANRSRKGGEWQLDKFDASMARRDVGRIFRQADGQWFWGVSFQLTGRKRYGQAAALDADKPVF